MNLIPIKTITDIQEGDVLLMEGHFGTGEARIQARTVENVKVSPNDGTEIIYDVKQNRYFNLGMYLDGKSWVKRLFKIDPTECTVGVDFNGLRRQAVGGYNALVSQLNASLQHGHMVDLSPADIADSLDRIRESLAVMIWMYREGEFTTLPMQLDHFEFNQEQE